jgi:hypothetical protein
VSKAALLAEQSTAGEFQFSSFLPDSARASREGVLLVDGLEEKVPTSSYAKLSPNKMTMLGFAEPQVCIKAERRRGTASLIADAGSRSGGCVHVLE